MRRRRRERGGALLWAVALMAAVSLAVAATAGALAGQAGAVRRLQQDAARADLLRAGRALARSGASPGEAMELAGGSVELVRLESGRLEIVMRPRGGPATRLPVD